MNYRHAFHAGNHTEIFKHAALCLVLAELRRKPKPFTVLDTHAGAGLYDLRSDEASRTGEAEEGIARVFGHDIPAALPYLDIVRATNPDGLTTYPGSPALTRALLRDDDRLIACELRPDDSALLKACFRDDRRIAVHQRDGYEAIGAFVPPATRRGLVFIDPPFERRDEFERLARALAAGLKKWPTGMFMAWYPVKDRAGPDLLRSRLGAAPAPTLCCEFFRARPDGETLTGSGLVVCNPPWRLDEALKALCAALKPKLCSSDAPFTIDWLVPEIA